ncbi:Transcription regulator [contains diacylglycerol kinase catalytic domain] [hydrothermal vent metagenome]|uniref:Transcription regulator [contains diacylglycerol kinase catalytic domain] n=1 Tax=hydrothermal vent metagenome TaxID=652676 RepID=A0A3B1D8C3_9ZZZZ
MSSSAVLIVNPVSGSFSEKRLLLSIEVLKKGFSDVSIFYTGKRGDAEQIAVDAVRKSPEMILAIGGDGTFNEVVNGTAYTDVPVAFIPAGTTNVLARELDFPADIYQATLKALDGKTEYVHLGRINDKYFVLMAGIGFDGKAVYRVNQRLKHLSGKGAYLISGLKCFMRYRPELLRIVVDDKVYEGYGLIVCNAGYYAGSFRVCPDAGLGAPHLYVSIMHGAKRSDLLRYVFDVVCGGRMSSERTTCIKGKSIVVSGDAHIQIDGDYFGTTPAVITFHERALRLIV